MIKVIGDKLSEEIVLLISLVLVFITSFFSFPKLSYIDFKVLISLFNLMVVICAFEKLKVLDRIAINILLRHKNQRRVSLVLIFLTFFSAMLITNDVALITFVPITLIIARKAAFNPMKLVIMQTLGANIGSSLTPMGNPQNLFLLSFYNINGIEFFKTTILFVVLGALWLLLLNYRTTARELNFSFDLEDVKEKNYIIKIILYILLFIFIILSVFNIVSYYAAFIATVILVSISDRELLLKIDYFLLVTFICFFVIIGNLSHIAVITDYMSSVLSSSSRVYIFSILFSQFISNVPCSILLAGFTKSWKELLLGVNIGGMGTLVASLASVISYKFYIKEYRDKTYLIKFHKYNFISLIIFTLIIYFFI